MKEYLKETKLLNYSCDTISNLIDSKGWKSLDEFNKIKETYNFVRDEILFGYNVCDEIPASKFKEVLYRNIGRHLMNRNVNRIRREL